MHSSWLIPRRTPLEGALLLIILMTFVLNTFWSESGDQTGHSSHQEVPLPKTSHLPVVEVPFIESHAHPLSYTPARSAPTEQDVYYPIPNSTLRKRRAIGKRAINPVSDDQFEQATAKGKQFTCWMADPSLAGSKAIPRFVDPMSIPEWGWALGESSFSPANTQTGYLEDLIAGSQGGLRWVYRHNVQHPNVDATEYPPTGASYNNVYWADKGVIVANSNYGPAYQIKKERTPLQRSGSDWDSNTMSPPQLAQLSDFWWLCWSAATQSHAPWTSGIRHIVRRNVENQVTVDLLAHVLKMNGLSEDGSAPMWPEKAVVDNVKEGFAALLSTPNVYAACWFVIQHGSKLGVRLTIEVC